MPDHGNRGEVLLTLENFRMTVTYLQFPVQVCFSATVGHLSSCITIKSRPLRPMDDFPVDAVIAPSSLKCFDVDSWVTERSSGLQNINLSSSARRLQRQGNIELLCACSLTAVPKSAFYQGRLHKRFKRVDGIPIICTPGS